MNIGILSKFIRWLLGVKISVTLPSDEYRHLVYIHPMAIIRKGKFGLRPSDEYRQLYMFIRWLLGVKISVTVPSDEYMHLVYIHPMAVMRKRKFRFYSSDNY